MKNNNRFVQWTDISQNIFELQLSSVGLQLLEPECFFQGQ